MGIPLSLIRHKPTTSKFSSANPIGSIIRWQPAHTARRSALGAALAQRLLCPTCHLPTYAGQQQVPRLAGQDETYLVAAMKQFRDHPGPGRDTIMAATLRGLNDDELAQLAHHLAHARP